jgi:hypothetical protein
MLELEGPPEPNDVSSDSGEEYIDKGPGSDVADEDDEEMVLNASGDEEVMGKKVTPGKKLKKEKGSLRKEVRSALGDERLGMSEITVNDKRKAENEL